MSCDNFELSLRASIEEPDVIAFFLTHFQIPPGSVMDEDSYWQFVQGRRFPQGWYHSSVVAIWISKPEFAACPTFQLMENASGNWLRCGTSTSIRMPQSGISVNSTKLMVKDDFFCIRLMGAWLKRLMTHMMVGM